MIHKLIRTLIVINLFPVSYKSKNTEVNHFKSLNMLILQYLSFAYLYKWNKRNTFFNFNKLN